MAEATCRRELDLEIPADEVTKAMERVAKEFARVARVPGFRPGKAPVSLIRRRFADDIKGEVVQSLVPERVEKAVSEQKLTPVSQPQVDKLDFAEGQPLKFRAVFEVLPEFELGSYKDLDLEMPVMDITDDDVNKALKEMTERAAAFAPVEGRPVEDGDFVQLKLVGTPEGGGEPLRADSVLCLEKSWHQRRKFFGKRLCVRGRLQGKGECKVILAHFVSPSLSIVGMRTTCTCLCFPTHTAIRSGSVRSNSLVPSLLTFLAGPRI